VASRVKPGGTWEVPGQRRNLDASLVPVKDASMANQPMFAHPRKGRLARVTPDEGDDGDERGAAEQWLEHAR